jgi:glutamate dehydrogenase
MSVADRPRSKLVLVRSLLGRHLFAFVWLPRDEVSTGRREAIGDMLAEAANAKLINWSIALEDGVVALLRYTLDLRGGGVMPDAAALDARLERMVRGWVPAVEAALVEQAGRRATRLALRFANAFPAVYRATSTPEEAARDILRIATLDAPAIVRCASAASDAKGRVPASSSTAGRRAGAVRCGAGIREFRLPRDRGSADPADRQRASSMISKSR